MQADMFDVPVVMIVFNRPSTTSRVFEVIEEIRPSKFLVIADGARDDRAADIAHCAQVREIVSRVDWPCDVYTNFSDVNLGCQERVISGLDWVFTLVEEAIILEDDCLPDASFFPFCRELLRRYRGDARVAAISGSNLLEAQSQGSDSYRFSKLGGIWGWATWRSEWRRYDRRLTDWPRARQERILQEIFDDSRAVAYWSRIFDAMYEGNGSSIWDYQWLYTRLMNNSVTAIPRVNLVTNIGFGAGSTHTLVVDPRLVVPRRTMVFPLVHPISMVPSRSLDRELQNLYSVPLSRKVAQKFGRIASRVLNAG
jgi:hypothetical protein